MDHGKKKMTMANLKAKITTKKALAEAKKAKGREDSRTVGAERVEYRSAVGHDQEETARYASHQP